MDASGTIDLRTKDLLDVEDEHINSQTMTALLVLVLGKQKQGDICAIA